MKMKMKMKKKLALLLAVLTLVGSLALGGCSRQTESTGAAEENRTAEETAAPETTAAETAAAETSETAAAKADYFDKVFDTSEDAGRLTVRYLYMTEDTQTSEGNVTTGDSSVYTSPEGLIMLVDCSCSASGDQVVEQLKAMGIEKIDILVLSHPHADHIGGFPNVAEAFEIGQIYMNDNEYDSDTYRNMMQIIQEKEIPWEYLYDGDSFMFGEQVEVKIYNPVEGGSEAISAGFMDANNYSIAMRLTYKEASFWTSGDLYVTGEQDVLDRYGDAIGSDIMKINHHGWSTSSLKDFIEAVSPLAAVAMHDTITTKTIAMRYSTRGIQTFYNCKDGAVRISTDGSRTYDIQSQFVRSYTAYGEPAEDGHYVLSR